MQIEEEGGANLVDDSRSGLPEANAVLGTSRGKEVVHLLVLLHSQRQIGDTTVLAITANAGFIKSIFFRLFIIMSPCASGLIIIQMNQIVPGIYHM